MIRVLLVDDHEGIRLVLRMAAALSPLAIDVVGEAETAKDAIEAAKWLEPDLVLLDIYLPDQTGIEAAPEIHKRWPKARIVLMSAMDPHSITLPADTEFYSKADNLMQIYDKLYS